MESIADLELQNMEIGILEMHLFSRRSPIGRDLKYRRSEINPALVHIAERCRIRLMQKGNRLLHAGKHVNKVKVVGLKPICVNEEAVCLNRAIRF